MPKKNTFPAEKNAKNYAYGRIGGGHDATHEYDLAGNDFPLAMMAGKVQAVLPLSNGLHDGRDD